MEHLEFWCTVFFLKTTPKISQIAGKLPAHYSSAPTCVRMCHAVAHSHVLDLCKHQVVLIRKGNCTETVDSTFPDLPILPTVASIEERIVKSEFLCKNFCAKIDV